MPVQVPAQLRQVGRLGAGVGVGTELGLRLGLGLRLRARVMARVGMYKYLLNSASIGYANKLKSLLLCGSVVLYVRDGMRHKEF